MLIENFIFSKNGSKWNIFQLNVQVCNESSADHAQADATGRIIIIDQRCDFFSVALIRLWRTKTSTPKPNLLTEPIFYIIVLFSFFFFPDAILSFQRFSWKKVVSGVGWGRLFLLSYLCNTNEPMVNFKLFRLYLISYHLFLIWWTNYWYLWKGYREAVSFNINIILLISPKKST